MALTRREAIKFAFLSKCADDGLTIEETAERAKAAADSLEKTAVLDTILKYLGSVGKTGVGMGEWAADKALSYGVPTALLAPPAIGALAGYGAARLTGGNDESPDDLKTQEKVDAYRLATEAAHASTQQAMRARQARGSQRRAFRDLV